MATDDTPTGRLTDEAHAACPLHEGSYTGQQCDSPGGLHLGECDALHNAIDNIEAIVRTDACVGMVRVETAHHMADTARKDERERLQQWFEEQGEVEMTGRFVAAILRGDEPDDRDACDRGDA